jgi:cell division protein FtsN
MNDKLRIILVMSVVLTLILIGLSKEDSPFEYQLIQDSYVEDKPIEIPEIEDESEIYYKYYLVSGSYLLWENAETQYNKLVSMGYECKILPETDGHGYYRVVLFWSDTYEEVKEYENNIKSDVPKCWILVK